MAGKGTIRAGLMPPERMAEIRRAIAIGVAAALLLAAAALAVGWAQQGKALTVGREVEERTDAVTFTLNDDIAAFKGTAVTADAVRERLRAGQHVLQEQSGQVTPLAGSGRTGRYRDVLQSYITSVSTYYDDVLFTADFLVERSRLATEVSHAFQALSQASTAATAGGASDRAAEAARAAATAADRLRGMSATPSAAYVNTALIEHLDELQKALDQLSAALAERDTSATQSAGARLGQLLRADWEALFYQPDESSITRFKTEAESLVERRREVTSARAELERERPRFGIGAIAVAVVALLLSISIRLR